MKQTILLYRFEIFGHGKELAGIFTSDKNLKKYLAGLKKDGLLSKEDMERVLKQGETCKLDPNYKLARFDRPLLNPPYRTDNTEYENKLSKICR
jgi:hypothetical protein